VSVTPLNGSSGISGYFNPLEGLAEVVSEIARKKQTGYHHFNPLEGLAEVVSLQPCCHQHYFFDFNPLEGLAEVVRWAWAWVLALMLF